MKKLIIAAVALSFAAPLLPTMASADTLVVRDHHRHHHYRHHCRVVHKRYRHHGHWVVRKVRICR
jgi:hypothetical protein